MTNLEINKTWKTEPCGQDDCWCLLVVTEDYSFETDNIEECIVPSGAMCKDTAKYLVKLHNEVHEIRRYIKHTPNNMELGKQIWHFMDVFDGE